MRVLSLIVALVTLQGGAQVGKQIPQKPNPTLRVYNATRSDKDIKLDLILDDSAVATGIAADSLSGPFTPKNLTSATLSVRKGGETKSLIDKPITLGGNDHVLVVTGDPDQTLEVSDVSVGPMISTDQQAHLAIFNALPKGTTDTWDVYVVAADGKIDTAEPMAKGVTSMPVSVAMAPSNSKVVVTRADSKTPVAESAPLDIKAMDRKVVLLAPGASPTDPPKIVVISL